MDHLRHLSVFVKEPQPGQFHWVLHESTDNISVWTVVESSPPHFRTWLDALEAGVTALMKVVADKPTGPRAPGPGPAPERYTNLFYRTVDE